MPTTDAPARSSYPDWLYFPLNQQPPGWVTSLVQVVSQREGSISSQVARKTSSDAVLRELRPGLEALGFKVETGKTRALKISRPVLFGRQGKPELEYQVDAFHDDLGIVVEVEAGRGARGNASYRDLIRAGLIANARHLVLLLPVAYHHKSRSREVSVPAFADCEHILRAVYASQRLRLPYDGVLLIGY